MEKGDKKMKKKENQDVKINLMKNSYLFPKKISNNKTKW
jgi:hypothetical protein